jgi:hypothetical protein
MRLPLKISIENYFEIGIIRGDVIKTVSPVKERIGEWSTTIIVHRREKPSL